MKRAWMLILLVSLGLNVGLAIQVFTGSDDDGRRHGSRRWDERRLEDRRWPAPGDTTAWRKAGYKRLERFRRRLDLSDDQATAFRANQERAMALLGGKRREIELVKSRIRTIMAEESVDREAVRAAHSELGLKQAEFDSLVTEFVLDDLETLDPDQREAYLRMHPYGPGERSGRHSRGERGRRSR
jgi:Spy/CpxP family protein refolding chaperone